MSDEPIIYMNGKLSAEPLHFVYFIFLRLSLEDSEAGEELDKDDTYLEIMHVFPTPAAPRTTSRYLLLFDGLGGRSPLLEFALDFLIVCKKERNFMTLAETLNRASSDDHCLSGINELSPHHRYLQLILIL